MKVGTYSRDLISKLNFYRPPSLSYAADRVFEYFLLETKDESLVIYSNSTQLIRYSVVYIRFEIDLRNIRIYLPQDSLLLRVEYRVKICKIRSKIIE